MTECTADGAAPRFLGPEWVAALDRAAREAADLADAAAEPLVVEQQVLTDAGPVAYHLVLGPGPARVHPGPAEHADLTIVATEDAARRIQAGEANAQACLADGTLRLRGNPDVLTRRAPALALVGDVLAAPRR